MQTQPAVELSFVMRDVGLGMTIVESFVNGIYTIIFAYTIWLMLSRRSSRRCTSFIAITILPYCLSITHLACRWDMIRQAFIINGSGEDTILSSLLNPSTWIVVSSTISLSLMTLIADSVMIWRCWVIWERNWKAPIAPLLATVIGSAFCVLSVIAQIQPERYNTDNRAKFTDSGIIYFSLSLASTVLSTSLIIYRIITVSRRTEVMSSYKGVIEIITESAALYAVVLIIFLPFFALKNFTQGYSQAILVPITGIAPTIVTARVSLGLCKEYKMNKARIPTLTNWESEVSAASMPTTFSLDLSTNRTTEHGEKACPECPRQGQEVV